MNLKEILAQFCKENQLDDLHCIIHIALLNYVANLSPKSGETINLSAKVFDSFTGIGIDKSNELFNYISKHTNLIEMYYEFNCLDNQDDYSFSILKKDIDDINKIEMDEGCSSCDEYHTFSINHDKYKISYLGYKDKITKELELKQDLIKEFVVLNTNEDHFEKLAKILASNLKVGKEEKEEAEKGLFKYMQSIKKFTGVISDISEDGAKTTGNVKSMIEDLTFISSLKDMFKEN